MVTQRIVSFSVFIFVSASSLHANEGLLLFPKVLAPSEPVSVEPLFGLSLQEIDELNQKRSGACSIERVSAPSNPGEFGIKVRDQLIFSSSNIYEAIAEAENLAAIDYCNLDEISPACSIKQDRKEDGQALFRIFVGQDYLLTTSDFTAAKELFRELRRVRLCHYGDRIFVPGR